MIISTLNNLFLFFLNGWNLLRNGVLSFKNSLNKTLKMWKEVNIFMETVVEQLKDMLIIQIIRLILASGQHTIQIDNYRLFLSHAMNVSFYTQSILHVDRGTNLIHLSKSSRAYFASFFRRKFCEVSLSCHFCFS